MWTQDLTTAGDRA